MCHTSPQPAIITVEALHLSPAALLPTTEGSPLGVYVALHAPHLQPAAVASTAIQRMTRDQGRVSIDQQHWVDLGPVGVLECQVWVCALEATRVERQHVGTARVPWGEGRPQSFAGFAVRDHGWVLCKVLCRFYTGC